MSDFIIKSNDNNKTPQQFLKVLSFNYRTIKCLDRVETAYLRLEELYLNHNLIESLSGIEQFRFLRVLEIKFNLIKDINEITKINSNEHLKSLNLLGNPVEKDYRFTFDFFHRTFPKYIFFKNICFLKKIEFFFFEKFGVSQRSEKWY